MIDHIKEATAYLKSHGIGAPEVGVILGTGLGNKFVEKIKNQVVINYNSIHTFLYPQWSFTKANSFMAM